ncbi:MAG: EpsG family protein, partial [Prevotella sp.]|nr:EpsG family protein [Prevotella sp.]
MAIIFIYFALFLGVHYISKTFSNPGKAQLFQLAACFILLFGFFGFRDITVLNDTSHYYGFYYQRAHVTKYLNETVFAYHIT